MEFIKEFAIFLFEKQALKFGDFTLASGKKSSYYIDLRIVPSFPHQFRKMVKYLQNQIIDKNNLDNFDSFVSVPTGGLVIASALAIETVKPLIYVRNKPKEYGTSKSVEGHITDEMKVLMIDDVATTGGSVIKAIKLLKEEKIQITDAWVIINRLEGADKALEEQGVKLHHVTDIMQITQALFEEKLVSEQVLEQVKQQIRNN
jgi:orotate phosphoribosyltransferase